MKLSASTFSEVPPWFETRTSTAPVPAGEVAVIFPVPLLYETEVAAVVPNTTVLVDEKLVPEISIVVPPPFGPVDLDRPVTVGGA